jgi:hypothetical protein
MAPGVRSRVCRQHAKISLTITRSLLGNPVFPLRWRFCSYGNGCLLSGDTSDCGAYPNAAANAAESHYPLTTQTGIESIDQILAAVSSGDVQTLRSLIEFSEAKCTHRDELGGPPKCREGEAEGTSVEVLSFLNSEGSFLRKDEIDVSRVYAVYEANAAVISSEGYYPHGTYMILFVSGEKQPAVACTLAQAGSYGLTQSLTRQPRI